jgi:hypothetical protein
MKKEIEAPGRVSDEWMAGLQKKGRLCDKRVKEPAGTGSGDSKKGGQWVFDAQTVEEIFYLTSIHSR